MDVKLEVFEGPFELLLRLVEKHEINIYDIPIAYLAEQYILALSELPPDMDGMSAFIIIAATLLEIKSRMLLPKPEGGDETQTEDPREALTQRLIEYKYFNTLASHLKNIEPPGLRAVRQSGVFLFMPENEAKQLTLFEDANQKNSSGFKIFLSGASPESLRDLFFALLARQDQKTDKVHYNYGNVPRERFTVQEKISEILKRLSETGRLLFSSLT